MLSCPVKSVVAGLHLQAHSPSLALLQFFSGALADLPVWQRLGQHRGPSQLDASVNVSGCSVFEFPVTFSIFPQLPFNNITGIVFPLLAF
jgi:hypothetical protein